MDERINDYNNYDKLVLFVRNKKVNEIIRYYNTLGYEIVENSENNKYSDTKDLTFVRPHTIKNKDRLQLLQIHLEVELNKMGKAEQHKHSLSINFALLFAFFGVLFMVLCIRNLLFVEDIVGMVLFACVGFTGLVCLFLVLIFTPKIIRRENKKFKQESDQINKNINFVLKNIKEARGVK